MQNDDVLLFSDEDEPEPPQAFSAAPWKILIVDDDQEVHAVTRIALDGMTYSGRPVVFLSAHSGAAAVRTMADEPDVAVILLDVVMETDDAGLRVVRRVREELGNANVRIVLRTGQPGQAPERQVIIDYDINDYKSKGEITAQKLFTAVMAALRSYDHIAALEAGRRGVERILEAAGTLFAQRSRDLFVERMLSQLTGLLGGGQAELLDAATIAGLPAELRTALAESHHHFGPEGSLLVFPVHTHKAAPVRIANHPPLGPLDRQLLEVFCAKVTVGLDNVFLHEQSLNAQKATVTALADLAEHKDTDTGDHVRRIERMAQATARELLNRGAFAGQLDTLLVERIGLASILHDVGKVSIPDRILMKPGPLDAEEWAVMRTHAAAGGAILKNASRMVSGTNYLSLAAEIAESHHEKYDGTGYPLGLKADAIPLSGRIVAVVDVFDALTSKRPYKEPWPVEKALAEIDNGAGKHFDPVVVEAFRATQAIGIF